MSEVPPVNDVIAPRQPAFGRLITFLLCCFSMALLALSSTKAYADSSFDCEHQWSFQDSAPISVAYIR